MRLEWFLVFFLLLLLLLIFLLYTYPVFLAVNETLLTLQYRLGTLCLYKLCSMIFLFAYMYLPTTRICVYEEFGAVLRRKAPEVIYLTAGFVFVTSFLSK